MQFLTNNILLIFILPLLACIVALSSYFYKFAITSETVKKTSLVSNILCLIYSVCLVCLYFMTDNLEPISYSLNWFNVGDLSISLGVLLDKVSVLYLFCLMLVGLTVNIASIKLLKETDKTELFYTFSNFLLFVMAAFVLSQNLIQSAVISVIAGFVMFSLLNLNFEKYNVSKYAEKFYLIDKFGDFCLFVSVFIFLYFILTYDMKLIGEILGYTSLADVSADVYVYMSDLNFAIFCSLFLLGIFAKVGIFPFHSKYLISSFEYSPAYYLIAFSMAITGGFFAFRMFPAFDFSEKLIYTIFIMFGLSVLYCIIVGLLNKCLKKNDCSNIVYSVIGNIFLILPFTMTSHSDLPNSEDKIYLYIIIFTVFYILFIISDIIIYLRNPKKSHNFATCDIINKIFSWFTDNIFDIPRNIVKIVDKFLIPFFENIVICLSKTVAWIISFNQNGKLQNYLLYVLVFISLMLILFLFLQVGTGEM